MCADARLEFCLNAGNFERAERVFNNKPIEAGQDCAAAWIRNADLSPIH